MSKAETYSFTLRDELTNTQPSGTTTSGFNTTYTGSLNVSGGSNPRYRQQIAAVQNAGTVLNATINSVSVIDGLAFMAWNELTGTAKGYHETKWTGLRDTAVYGTPSFDSSAEASAVRSLYSEIREAHQQFQGGVFLGELRETLDLIRHPTQALLKRTFSYLNNARKTAKAITKLKERYRGTAFKRGQGLRLLQKQLANDYLVWAYGVKPLMGDIKDGVKAYKRIMEDIPVTRFRALGIRESTSSANNGDLSNGRFTCHRRTYTIGRSFVGYYGGFKAAERDPGLMAQATRIADLSGFSLAQFVPTVWNLIPYSFLVDYVVNVGDLLEAATTDTSGVAWLMRTQVVETVLYRAITPDLELSSAFMTPLTSYQPLARSGSTGGFVTTNRVISRAPATVPVMVPRLNIEFSAGRHILNAVALIRAR